MQALGIGMEGTSAPTSAVGSVVVAWKSDLLDQGFVVFNAKIGEDLASRGASAIRSRVQHALQMYGVNGAKKNLASALRSSARHFGKSPEGWTGIAFGGYDKRGWHLRVGSGRVFERWDHPDILSIREATRSIACEWHGVPGDALRGHPESCSMKVPGCPALEAHLDKERRGTLQIVIALSKTKGIVWPGSHKYIFGKSADKFYKLSQADLRLLKSKGCQKKEVDLDVGSVLVFLGGVMVHGSPAVQDGEAPRIMTYAHWSVEGRSESADGSGAAVG